LTQSIKVVDTIPSYKVVDELNKQVSSITLNKYMNTNYGVTLSGLTNNLFGLSLSDVDAIFVASSGKQGSDISFTLDENDASKFIVSLTDNTKVGKYVYNLYPKYEGYQDAITKPYKLTINVINSKPTVKFTVNGSINPLDSSSEVILTPTITNGQYLSLKDNMNVELSDNVKDIFNASIIGNKLHLSLKDNVEITKDTTYKNIVSYVELKETEYDIESYPVSVSIKETIPTIKLDKKSLILYNNTKDNILIGEINVSLDKVNADLNMNANYCILDNSKYNSKLNGAFETKLVKEEIGNKTYYKLQVYLKDHSKLKHSSKSILKYEIGYLNDNYSKKKVSVISFEIVDKTNSIKK